MLTELEDGAPGSRSAIFGKVIVKDADERLAAAVVSTGSVCLHSGAFGRPKMCPSAVDLSLVDAGHAPVLLEHDCSWTGLIGRVEAAWFEQRELRSILRFGTAPQAELAWRSVLDDLPVRVSMGFTILDIEPDGDDGAHLYTKWRLDEISLCLRGKDPGARLRVAESPLERERLALIIDLKRDLSRKQRRDALLAKIGAPEWRAWSERAAVDLAREFGISAQMLRGALSRRVETQLETIVDRD